MKILVNLFLLILAFQISFGQEKPQARKIDEFGKVTCEDFWNRVDNFNNELLSQPNSVGYAVINRNSQNKEDVKLGLRLRNQIVALLQRSLKNDRFTVGKKDSEEFGVEFWIVPSGAEVSFNFDDNWKTDFPQILKPKVYSKNWLNETGVCPPSSDITFAEILLNDQNLSGNIVILASTRKKFSQIKKEFLENFAQKYNLLANRFNTFFVNDPNYEGVEYWLVPKKKLH